MATTYTINNKNVTVENGIGLNLYQVNNNKLLYKSVSIHRDGTVCIEEYDGNYSDSYSNEKEFNRVRKDIHKQIEKLIPELINNDYFRQDGLNKIFNDKMDIIFYTNYYSYHLYDAIFVDKDLKNIQHFYL